MLYSCGGGKSGGPNPETLVTQEVDSIFVVESKNGMKSYRFEAPKMIGYDLAREPYEEYPLGVFVETFRDSTEEIESSLRADYAINHKSRTRSLWEAIGNVVATGEDGRTLYTEQLFWDDQTERIYSNVDCRIEQADGIYIGDGLESDQALKYWRFRNTVSKLDIDSPSGRQGTSPEGGEPDAGENAPGSDVQPIAPPSGSPDAEHSEADRATQPGRTAPQEGAEEPAEAIRNAPRRTIQPVEEDMTTVSADSNTEAVPVARDMRESHLRQRSNEAAGQRQQRKRSE